MATTYTLVFEQFKVLNQYETMTDVIREVHWRLNAITDDVEPIEVTTYGSAILDYPEVGTFVSRASVTPAIVKTWLESIVDEHGNNLIQSAKDGLDAQIAKLVAPVDHMDNPEQVFKDGIAV